jgi:hypothetical protein
MSRIKSNLVVQNIEPFGVNSQNGVEAIGPSFPPFYQSGGLVKSLKISNGKVSNPAYVVAYAPLSVQEKLIRQGWTPARVMAANRVEQIQAIPPSGVQLSLIAEILIISKAINFQKPDVPVYVPFFTAAFNGTSLGILGGYQLSYKEALSKLGSPEVVQFGCDSLKASAGGTDWYKIDKALLDLNQKMLSSKKIPYLRDVETSWSCFSDYTASDVPKEFHFFPLPPNSIRYILNADKVNLREKSNKDSKVLDVLKKNTEMLNWATVGSEFSGVHIKPNTYGYVSSNYLSRPEDCQNWFGIKQEPIKESAPAVIVSEKDVKESEKPPEGVNIEQTNIEQQQIPDLKIGGGNDTTLKEILNQQNQNTPQAKKTEYSKYIAVGVGVVCVAGLAILAKKMLEKKDER